LPTPSLHLEIGFAQQALIILLRWLGQAAAEEAAAAHSLLQI